MNDWRPGMEPPEVRIGPLGWALVALRGLVLVLITFGGLAILLILRQIERPVHGLNRPWTPWIVQAVCAAALVVIGLRFRVEGSRMRQRGAVVANHASWLDIFVLNARKRVYFVSKAEVARWPAIGWLARATGTVFINRDPREARAQQQIFEQRLLAGHRLLFFPEGTSTDGRRVLPFKSTLFQAFLTPHLVDEMHIQPVTLIYRAPAGADRQFYGWWGEMAFGPHLAQVLAARRQGSVTVLYHPALKVADFADRKTLAAAAEAAVRAGLPEDL